MNPKVIMYGLVVNGEKSQVFPAAQKLCWEYQAEQLIKAPQVREGILEQI